MKNIILILSLVIVNHTALLAMKRAHFSSAETQESNKRVKLYKALTIVCEGNAEIDSTDEIALMSPAIEAKIKELGGIEKVAAHSKIHLDYRREIMEILLSSMSELKRKLENPSLTEDQIKLILAEILLRDSRINENNIDYILCAAGSIYAPICAAVCYLQQVRLEKKQNWAYKEIFSQDRPEIQMGITEAPMPKNSKSLTLVCLNDVEVLVPYEIIHTSSFFQSNFDNSGGKIFVKRYHDEIIKILIKYMVFEANLVEESLTKAEVVDKLVNLLLEHGDVTSKNYVYLCNVALALKCDLLSEALIKTKEKFSIATPVDSPEEFDIANCEAENDEMVQESISITPPLKKKRTKNSKRDTSTDTSKNNPSAKKANKKEDELPYVCGEGTCPMRYKTLPQLKRHKVTHGPKKYICDECKMAFHFKDKLVRHANVHERKRPYGCDFSGCGRYFGNQSELTLHKKYHTGETQVQCDICFEKLANQGSLKRHKEIIHDNKKSYPCHHVGCPYTAYDNSDLEKHMKYKHFQCPHECGFVAPNRGLKQHIKESHP